MAGSVPFVFTVLKDALVGLRSSPVDTPRAPRLGFDDAGGFPYKTLNVRMPEILERVIADVQGRLLYLPSASVGAGAGECTFCRILVQTTFLCSKRTRANCGCTLHSDSLMWRGWESHIHRRAVHLPHAAGQCIF